MVICSARTIRSRILLRAGHSIERPVESVRFLYFLRKNNFFDSGISWRSGKNSKKNTRN